MPRFPVLATVLLAAVLLTTVDDCGTGGLLGTTFGTSGH